MRLTDDDRARIHELRAEGLTHRAIAKEIGCGHTTVRRVLDPDCAEYHRRASEKWRQDNPEYAAQWRNEHLEYAQERERQYYADNREARLAAGRQWYADNSEHVREMSVKWYLANPVTAAVGDARKRSKNLDVPFDPAIKDVIGNPPDNCPVCGVAMQSHRGEGIGPQNDSPSIDRLIPELGYVPGNVQWLCNLCNAIKHKDTMADLLDRLAANESQ